MTALIGWSWVHYAIQSEWSDLASCLVASGGFAFSDTFMAANCKNTINGISLYFYCGHQLQSNTACIALSVPFIRSCTLATNSQLETCSPQSREGNMRNSCSTITHLYHGSYSQVVYMQILMASDLKTHTLPQSHQHYDQHLHFVARKQ